MPLLLVVLFIVVPLAELYVIIQVGGLIGVLPTIAVLLVDSLIGSWLLRAQGRSAWRRFNDTLAAGRPPAREVLDGVLIVFGGAFLITPGFITDVVGILLLLPPTRALLRGLIARRLILRVAGPAAARRMRPPPARRRARRDYDVDGTATEVDAQALREP